MHSMQCSTPPIWLTPPERRSLDDKPREPNFLSIAQHSTVEAPAMWHHLLRHDRLTPPAAPQTDQSPPTVSHRPRPTSSTIHGAPFPQQEHSAASNADEDSPSEQQRSIGIIELQDEMLHSITSLLSPRMDSRKRRRPDHDLPSRSVFQGTLVFNPEDDRLTLKLGRQPQRSVHIDLPGTNSVRASTPAFPGPKTEPSSSPLTFSMPDLQMHAQMSNSDGFSPGEELQFRKRHKTGAHHVVVLCCHTNWFSASSAPSWVCEEDMFHETLTRLAPFTESSFFPCGELYS